jgi:phosphopantothenoylcysteine synthetase/decarboxylase
MRLAMRSDVVLVLPATANTIANVANGSAGDLISATILGCEKPVFFFPGMNRTMWEKPAVQRNANQLREDGYHVPEPSYQRGLELADWSVGEHPALPAPAKVIEIVKSVLDDATVLKATH